MKDINKTKFQENIIFIKYLKSPKQHQTAENFVCACVRVFVINILKLIIGHTTAEWIKHYDHSEIL